MGVFGDFKGSNDPEHYANAAGLGALSIPEPALSGVINSALDCLKYQIEQFSRLDNLPAKDSKFSPTMVKHLQTQIKQTAAFIISEIEKREK